jgi:PAS domain S-box-containing protein
MPTPPETPRRKSDPTKRDEESQDIPAETERLVQEQIHELQAEMDALRRENAELRLAAAERKRGEEALRQEKDRVGAILSALDTGQSLVDPDMTIVWVNQKAREFFPEYEPVGGKCYRLFEGMSEPCEVCAARQAFSTGEVTRIEKFVPYRGRWFHIIAQPMKDASGQVIQVLESFLDITERKRAEEALRESEAKYRTLVETALDIVLIHDGERILYINPTGANLLGASRPAEIIGRNVLEIVHPDFRDGVRENFTMDLLGKPTPANQLQLLRLDGTSFWVEGKGVMTCIGGSPAVQVIIRDITKRKRAEEALQESEKKYRNLVELAPEPIAVHRHGVLVYVNPPCVTLFGAEKPEDLVGKPTLQFVHPDDHDVVIGRIRQMTGKGTTVPRIAERFVKHDGQVVDVEVVATPIMFENLPSIMVLFRDITERKRAEEAIMRHTEELIQLNRQLEEADREANLYLDILTHDIGNTENVSNLYADLLIESLDGEAAGYAEKLQRSVQKSIEILGTVSTIRRIHRTTAGLKPMDLDAAVRGVIGDYPGSIFRYDGTHLLVRADDLLPVVFTNLIGNAIKHGGPGVEVAVAVEEENGEVLVTVADTGPGVADGDKEAIFHRYEQQKRGVGEGLGLYLVQILVERYGGRVWVEDRVPGRSEKGAAFRFTLRKA